MLCFSEFTVATSMGQAPQRVPLPSSKYVSQEPRHKVIYLYNTDQWFFFCPTDNVLMLTDLSLLCFRLLDK